MHESSLSRLPPTKETKNLRLFPDFSLTKSIKYELKKSNQYHLSSQFTWIIRDLKLPLRDVKLLRTINKEREHLRLKTWRKEEVALTNRQIN